MIQNKRKIASILFVLISVLCFAQELPPPGAPPPPGTPIDGGVLIGACLALIYGVKKLLKNN
ncbi:PID-CTERM protein-sorting domain-containing protein [Confluentibacter flavum]